MLFRYLAARWRHPGAAVDRHIRAGLGLENRARALSLFWNEHFSRTRAAQARWARTCQGDRLTVLGAGALLDLNMGALSPKFRRFRLVDANPLVVAEWGRVQMPVEPVICDVTNCLAAWTEELRAFRGGWAQTLAMIRELGQRPVRAYSTPTDGLLSLNLLSQLDIGWQEAVEPVLRGRFGRRFVQERDQEWLRAIVPGSMALIERHVAGLGESGARDVLLITDVEYVEYRGRAYSKLRWEEPPVSWSEGGWQSETGVEFEVLPALEGLVFSGETFERLMPGYQLEWQESWLWHISPLGTETMEYGKVHRVQAFGLRKVGGEGL